MSDLREAPVSSRSLMNAISSAMDRQPGLRSLALTGLFLIACFSVLWVAKEVFIPLTFALMLSLLFQPVVRALQAAFIPRAIGSAIVIMAVLAVMTAGGMKLTEPAVEWAQRLPQAMQVLETRLRPLKKPVDKVSAFAERVERLTELHQTTDVKEVRVEQPGLASAAFEMTGELIAGAIVAIFTLYFLLVSGDALLSRIVGLVPDLRSQQRASGVVRQIERRMSSYLGTICIINGGVGLAVGMSCEFLNLPNAVLWGVLAAVLNFVPYLGAMVGIIVVGLASLVSFPHLSDAILPPAAYLAFTTVEGNVITPMVLGRAFRISPLIIFVWLVFWAWLWGVPGAIVAVPLLMLVKITCEQSDDLAGIAEFLRR